MGIFRFTGRTSSRISSPISSSLLTEREDGQLQLGDSPELGPHYITFDKQPEKGSKELFDPDNKRPFGVNHMQIGAYEDLMAPLYTGALAEGYGSCC